ncbi:hypothetical protein [Corticibacter populi]|nr:hypothetical protein [Corticibacter populi]RZS31945.1 hypothetical protein EV687_2625 [Corticibacter populi]
MAAIAARTSQHGRSQFGKQDTGLSANLQGALRDRHGGSGHGRAGGGAGGDWYVGEASFSCGIGSGQMRVKAVAANQIPSPIFSINIKKKIKHT